MLQVDHNFSPTPLRSPTTEDNHHMSPTDHHTGVRIDARQQFDAIVSILAERTRCDPACTMHEFEARQYLRPLLDRPHLLRGLLHLVDTYATDPEFVAYLDTAEADAAALGRGMHLDDEDAEDEVTVDEDTDQGRGLPEPCE